MGPLEQQQKKRRSRATRVDVPKSGQASTCDSNATTCVAIVPIDWRRLRPVKRDIRGASVLKDGRVVFNIAGNKYRIVVWINYPYRVVYVRFIGTHRGIPDQAGGVVALPETRAKSNLIPEHWYQ